MAKPDLMVMVPDLYCRRRRRQGRRRLPSHPPEPQGHLENAFMSRHNLLNRIILTKYDALGTQRA